MYDETKRPMLIVSKLNHNNRTIQPPNNGLSLIWAPPTCMEEGPTSVRGPVDTIEKPK